MAHAELNITRPETTVASAGIFPGTPFVLADGTCEALKWLGFTLMVADHINKYFFAEQLPGVFFAGRIVMPLFGFILAYNLARPEALKRDVHRRIMGRLLLVGCIATLPAILLNQTVVAHYLWWPLNILFTLALFVTLASLIERGGILNRVTAALLFIVVGAFVEYLWLGVLVCLGSWAFCLKPTRARFVLWCLSVLSLTLINSNTWGLLAIPLILIASRFPLHVARSRWAFYFLYPAHLCVLCLFKIA